MSERPKDGEVLIALMGITGAGKTTFVSVASGRTDLNIGYGVDPCTQIPQAIPMELDGYRIKLIDTPGFDDDARTDVEIMEDVGRWLVKEGYVKGHQMDGLILLQPITYNRVGGSERRRTRLLQKILGNDAYKRVVIATTMWDDINNPEAMQARLDARSKEGGVWGDMCRGGATVLRHDNNQESAHRIIRTIIEQSKKYGKMKPSVQLELMANNGRVVETAAGKELQDQLEKEIEFIMDQIHEHNRDRPSERSRRSKDPVRKRRVREWDQEKQDLMRNLERRQSQLKKLRSLTVRVRSFLSRLFGA
ncbi:GTP-binding protein A [Podospora aff. communis PSN243]|uniref:GTP-binding protein A n=1 Tax=Podospora aff. communis PSN243 TaxID=3040156 RepID=A0AAV9GUY7_9PEZI|nr:GTP-binding protein A [Podospora aff. communis PSN243]